jgi:solute carrier family 36 (proton-coupled amino acid transporter)
LRAQRSKSFSISRAEPEAASLRMPGALRRDYLHRTASPAQSTSGFSRSNIAEAGLGQPGEARLFTNNFLEFLTLYGHFAGEELEEEDETEDYFTAPADEEERPDERTGLLRPKLPGRSRSRKGRSAGQTTSVGAALLLLKSFVGTGVLFLPRAFLNGGMLFSSLVLIGVAVLSYYCFILLVKTQLKVGGSFGDIGDVLYGKIMRNLILASIVLSQIGFVAAYIVFTSENLQAFIIAVSKCTTKIDIKFMVLMQLIIFLPLSLIRDISKLGFTALIADAFILLGLIYLGYFDIYTLFSNGGISDIVPFNPNTWTLFIGTAIFTFEGIGLIIPIQESMRNPANFPPVLAVVMVIITIIFTGMGALSYAAFGSATKTVVLLNLPQDNKFVNAVQFLYSLAILLSTPLQLFPAIRILENELFTRSGKYNPWIKWQKNIFRFFLVMFCALVAWGGAGDLDKFVALVGSFACVPLVYVYPVSAF